MHSFVVFCDVEDEKSAFFNCSSLCQHRAQSRAPLFSLQHNNTQHAQPPFTFRISSQVLVKHGGQKYAYPHLCPILLYYAKHFMSNP